MEQGKRERLTPAGKAVIAKIVIAGRKNEKYKKPLIVVLVIVLTWFYLLSYIKEWFEKNRKKVISLLIMALGIIGIITIIFILIPDQDDIKHRKNIDELQEIITNTKEADKQEIETDAQTIEESYLDITELSLMNPDCVGWLSIADTKISYPVMQHAGDEDYYLHKDFYKEKNKNGSLILDEDSSISENCDNVIIHGHNMKSGEMFGELEKYKDKKYAKEHNLIKLDTLEGEKEYLVMAVFYSRVFYEDEEVFKFYNFFQAETYSAFLDYYDNIKELSLYDTGVTAEWGDKFITLSTCSYQEENGRFVVVGKLVE